MERTDFMDIVYNLLKDDPDNNRANEIIDAADAYADEYAESMVKDAMEECFFVLKNDLEGGVDG